MNTDETPANEARYAGFFHAQRVSTVMLNMRCLQVRKKIMQAALMPGPDMPIIKERLTRGP